MAAKQGRYKLCTVAATLLLQYNSNTNANTIGSPPIHSLPQKLRAGKLYLGNEWCSTSEAGRERGSPKYRTAPLVRI